MNRRRLLIGLAAAVVLAVLASTFVYRQIKQTPVVQQQVPQTQIVVAAMPLALGTRLDDHDLRLVPWPGNEPLPGMFTRTQDVVGRAIITSMVQNEPVLESKLAPREAGAGLPATIPEGMRAVSVAVNEVIGVAGFVGPGTMVDVLATGTPGQGGGDTVTKTVLENVKVLAAGQQITQDAQGKPHTVPVVTLLVSPPDSDKLTMAATQGRIQLALRNTIDTKLANPPPVLEAQLFSAAGAAGPPKRAPVHKERVVPQAPPPYVVEVISGDKRETKSFPNH
ncbi:MAG TPA: Flp pilus assembly protein CpaB [Candidatus Acidoferrales bacterium]|nr:Flp pilus assembly protein CpaB [Candidatus Acidoferrales bacterium]